MSIRLLRVVVFGSAVIVAHSLTAAVDASSSQAEQLRVVQTMSDLLRARIDQLPVLISADDEIGKIQERTITLNREAVIVEGQRFDGLVVTAPKEKASFAWAFAAPLNSVSWYILREKGEMKGFANFLRRPRSALPQATGIKPENVVDLTFQSLGSVAWSAEERYVLWFRFKDEEPATLTIRAGFFAKPSLNNNALPALLFPARNN